MRKKVFIILFSFILLVNCSAQAGGNDTREEEFEKPYQYFDFSQGIVDLRTGEKWIVNYSPEKREIYSFNGTKFAMLKTDKNTKFQKLFNDYEVKYMDLMSHIKVEKEKGKNYEKIISINNDYQAKVIYSVIQTKVKSEYNSEITLYKKNKVIKKIYFDYNFIDDAMVFEIEKESYLVIVLFSFGASGCSSGVFIYQLI